jgi:hypothetical protein
MNARSPWRLLAAARWPAGKGYGNAVQCRCVEQWMRMGPLGRHGSNKIIETSTDIDRYACVLGTSLGTATAHRTKASPTPLERRALLPLPRINACD